MFTARVNGISCVDRGRLPLPQICSYLKSRDSTREDRIVMTLRATVCTFFIGFYVSVDT